MAATDRTQLRQEVERELRPLGARGGELVVLDRAGGGYVRAGARPALARTLTHAPFAVTAHPTHLELTTNRRGRQTLVGLSVAGGTVAALALRVVDPDESTLRAHLNANASLGHAPFVYALRPLSEHFRALLEPLIDWHHGPHAAPA